MGNYENLLIEKNGYVSTVTINRPDKLNALNEPTRYELVQALDELQSDDDVRVAVLTGAGEKAFIAGADIKDFEGRSPIDQFKAMKESGLFDKAEDFTKPLIAAINGFCLGGGCELAMACDIRVASEKAKLGQPEINLGIIPGGGGTQRLPRIVPLGSAYKLLYTGEMIKADEAYRIGLVDELVSPEGLMERVAELAATIAEKSPVALALIKEAVKASKRTSLDEGLRVESALFAMSFSSEDKTEGIDAFLNKRKAEFKGR
jgi:enoyl-CoA hydratase